VLTQRVDHLPWSTATPASPGWTPSCRSWSVYHPFWLGLGAAAFGLLLALLATSLLRTRISPRLWRAVHWAAYACWPIALVRGFGIGAGDTRSGWGLAAAVGAVLWRVGTTIPTRPHVGVSTRKRGRDDDRDTSGHPPPAARRLV